VAEIAARLTEVFDVSLETAFRDAAQIIQCLCNLHLLEIASEKPAEHEFLVKEGQ
jgi:hypothetical protein